jgi:DNA-binding beta-propeller fold protein YncE
VNESRFDALTRLLTNGAATRRALGQGLAGGALASGLTLLGLNDADARRRKKGKKRKSKKRRGGNGGDDGGGDDRCEFTLCDGECVDLDSERAHCGRCGRSCPGNFVCTAGFCVVAVGRRGDGDGEFDGPLGIAASREAFMFVPDGNNQRVHRINARALTGTFGEAGDEDGQFLRAAGVAVNQDTGDIYVSDIQRHRIQRFGNADSVAIAFELGFGEEGSGEGRVSAPAGLAVDEATGDVFVADTGNDRIQRVSASGSPRGGFGRTGSGEGQFVGPLGIAIDRDRNVVVADTQNHRIQVLDRDGNFIRAFGRQGSGDGELDRPVAVAFDAAGDIFVVDRGNHRVQQFTSTGQFRKAFGRQGTALSEFDNPFGIAVAPDGTIAVVDEGNHRVQFFVPARAATERLGHDARSDQQRSRHERKGAQQ